MNIYQITAKIAKEKYLKLRNRLEKSIASGRFDSLSRKKKDALINNVEKQRLKLDKFGLKGALAAGSLLVAGAANAQDPEFFGKSGVNAFAGSSNQGEAANLDGDADLEIILSTSTGGVILNGNYSSGFTSVAPTALSGMTGDFIFGDFDGDDIPDLAFKNGVSLDVALNDGSGGFASTNAVTSGTIGDMIVADIDSDGDNDIVYTTGSDTYLNVLKNNGSGTFTTSTVNTGATYQIDQIAIVDIDDDGDKDLVASEYDYYPYVSEPFPTGPYYYDNLNVFINTANAPGDPIFGGGNTINSFFYGDINDIAVADVDGDETLDIVLSNTYSFGGYSDIYLFKGSSSGQNNFSASEQDNYYMNYDYSFREFELTDVDIDGDLDVLVSLDSRNPALLRVENNQFSYYLLDQYYGNSGAFGNFSTYGIDMVLGDFDGDDQEDIVVAGSGSSFIYLNTFVPPFPKFVGNAVIDENSPVGTKVGYIETYGNDITVTMGGDDANFFNLDPVTFELTIASEVDFETVGSTLSITFDITLDEETTTANQTIAIANKAEVGKGTLNESILQLFGDSPTVKFLSADVDNDGDQDLLVSNQSGGGEGPILVDRETLDSYYANVLFRQVSAGIFVPQPIYDLDSYPLTSMQFIDADGDGDLDLLGTSRGFYDGCCGGEEVGILENTGEYFTSDTSLTAAGGEEVNNMKNLVTGDFDGDGIDDMVLSMNRRAYAFAGTDYGFAETSVGLTIGGEYDVVKSVTGDIDNDGFDDVVLLYDEGESAVIYGKEDLFSSSIAPVGAFATYDESNGYIGGEAFDIELSDLDGDGDLDAVLSREDGVYAYLRGTGGFTSGNLILDTYTAPYSSGSSYGEYGSAFDVTIADMDGDGDADLVTFDYNKYVNNDTEEITHSFSVKLHLNDGDGNFTLAQDFESGGAALPFLPSSYSKYTLDLIDVDGDDDLDVVINNNASEFLNLFGDKYNFEADFTSGLTVFKNDNLAPTGISLDETSFDENLAIATQVATVSVEDPNLGDTHTLFMSAGDGENDVDNSKFVIDGDKLLILEAPDFETQAEYKIHIKAIDDDFGSVTQAFTLTVNDIEPEVSGLDDEKSITLYPNPGRDVINLSIENKSQGDMRIRVSDLSGRIIHELNDVKRYDQWSKTVPMASQEPGIYMVEVEIGDITLKQRWIKQE
ncbi:FG-GAP-like repeat-containing protein [Ekhidna sp. MALMAid0563]|uniref:FG-GAP-like repeat-containing protein n=1 Tax=Ekhidna sp. MALMAid0563 TaxID=3143937 RepID=UPI0032DEA7EF